MELTSQHEELKRSAIKFVDTEINPYVDQWEQDEIFPAHEVFKKLGDNGFLGVTNQKNTVDQVLITLTVQFLMKHWQV